MALELIHVYKNFGDKNVFTNLNLSFAEKKVTSVMGPSGSGKTTLINLMLGIYRPDYGELRGFRNKQFSVVFQEDRLLEHKNGINNILFAVRNPKAHEECAWGLMMDCGLSEDAYKKTAEYSGGMKRRLSLCRALITDFDVLILDEPFKGLDETLKPKIMRMVQKRCADKTVIIVTHDKSEAAYFGSEVIDITNPPCV